jgi:hypothetical protein
MTVTASAAARPSGTSQFDAKSRSGIQGGDIENDAGLACGDKPSRGAFHGLGGSPDTPRRIASNNYVSATLAV